MLLRLTKSIIPALFVSLLLAVPASAALPGQRTDMRVLVLSVTGNEASTQAWTTALDREGVPYDSIVAGDPQRARLSASSFADTVDGTPRAKYQGVVVATGGLYDFSVSPAVSALSADEWTALKEYEATYGIRQVTASVYPAP